MSRLASELFEKANAVPTRIPLIADGREITMKEIADRARAAEHLTKDITGPVLVLAERPEQLLGSMLGILAGGSSPILCDPHWTADEFSGARSAVDARACLWDDEDFPVPRADRIDGQLCQEGITSIRISSQPRVRERRGRPSDSPIDPTELAIGLFTSGATGTPKAVLHSEEAVIGGLTSFAATRKDYFRGGPLQLVRVGFRLFQLFGRRLIGIGLARELRIATPFRLSGISGLSLALQCVLRNDVLIAETEFHPRRFAQRVSSSRATVIACAPSHARMILRLRDLDEIDMSRVFLVGLGGSPVPPVLAAEVQRRLRCAVTIGYGATELGGGVTITRLFDPMDRQTTSVGRAFEHAQIRIVNPMTRLPVPSGVVGDVECRTFEPGGAPVASSTGGEEWLRTGDLGCLDSDGYLQILGRSDDMLIVGGNNVYPSEIEGIIEEHPAVERAAVVGAIRVSGEMTVVAFVSPTAVVVHDWSELQRYCADRLSIHKVPTQIYEIEHMPLTTDGKVRKHALPTPWLDGNRLPRNDLRRIRRPSD